MKPNSSAAFSRPFEQEGEHITRGVRRKRPLVALITDNLVRLMGGEIVVKSKQGEGSTSRCLSVCRSLSRRRQRRSGSHRNGGAGQKEENEKCIPRPPHP